MSDQYFIEKAEDFLESSEGLIQDGDYEAVKEKLFLLLKNTARDQRYACIQACHMFFSEIMMDKITAVVHNTEADSMVY